ncbi:MAG: hypothetical protein AUJ57_10395 [Zetaproteobacteria bacterium CG1_02_53_45]|nr:MAG: hypothetical protein AUJ57_10395 [Zetaproteobacteria bacterium CG1_02_53_45]
MGRAPLILIVDEHENIRSILQKLIQALGYQSLLAPDSFTAVQLLEQHTADLVLLDGMMTDNAIMHVITAVRSQSTPAGIIMMTDAEHLHDIAAFIKAGADDFLLKPFNATLFKSRIMHALGSIRHSYEIKHLQEMLNDYRLREQQSEMDHSAFYQTLAHDLNNILTGILMRSELLLLKEQPVHTSKGLQDIMEAAEQISTLIHERKKSPIS